MGGETDGRNSILKNHKSFLQLHLHVYSTGPLPEGDRLYIKARRVPNVRGPIIIPKVSLSFSPINLSFFPVSLSFSPGFNPVYEAFCVSRTVLTVSSTGLLIL